MNEYEVTIVYQAYSTHLVQASSEEAAKEIAWREYESKDVTGYGMSEIYEIEEKEKA